MRASRVRPVALLAWVLLIFIVAVGVKLRIEEPLSSPALGAEDPFTHVVFTKEALERGEFGDSEYLGTSMYPPGMHALMGVVAPLSGISLYEFARFAPVAFGALAILGTFVLVSRLLSPSAGLAAALVTAVLPEHVFRSSLLFPTALDLAILPGYLLLFHFAQERGEQRWAAAAAFLLLSAPLAFMHPWAVPLFVAPALAYAMLRAVREEMPADVPRRLVLPAAAAALATAFAMASRWEMSDTGFADFFRHVGPLSALGRVTLPPPVLFVLLALIIGTACLAGIAAAWFVAHARRTLSERSRRVTGIVAGVALLATVVIIASGKLPLGVDYAHNLGAVTIFLALVGLALAAAAPTRAGDLALALGLVLFPLTAFNPLDSEFWPSRTVVYLAIPVAILAGAAVGWAVDGAAGYFARGRASRIVAPVAVLSSVLLVGGAMATHPPETYRWYRLYSDDEFAVLQELAAELDADGDARVVVYSWQPAVVLRALADPDHPRYAPKYYSFDETRDKIDKEKGLPKYVLVDKHVVKAEKAGKVDLSFLGSGYRLVKENDAGTLRVYQKEGS